MKYPSANWNIYKTSSAKIGRKDAKQVYLREHIFDVIFIVREHGAKNAKAFRAALRGKVQKFGKKMPGKRACVSILQHSLVLSCFFMENGV